MLRVHMIVKGYVQGVGFRYFVQKTALLFGVCGWARNKSDGSVEIDAEGNKSAIAAFTQSVEQGNSFSRIDSVNIEKTRELMRCGSFEIEDDE